MITQDTWEMLQDRKLEMIMFIYSMCGKELHCKVSFLCVNILYIALCEFIMDSYFLHKDSKQTNHDSSFLSDYCPVLFSDPSELDLVLVIVGMVVSSSLVTVMLLLVWLAYRRRVIWLLHSAAPPHACCCCMCPGGDLILP